MWGFAPTAPLLLRACLRLWDAFAEMGRECGTLLTVFAVIRKWIAGCRRLQAQTKLWALHYFLKPIQPSTSNFVLNFTILKFHFILSIYLLCKVSWSIKKAIWHRTKLSLICSQWRWTVPIHGTALFFSNRNQTRLFQTLLLNLKHVFSTENQSRKWPKLRGRTN